MLDAATLTILQIASCSLYPPQVQRRLHLSYRNDLLRLIPSHPFKASGKLPYFVRYIAANFYQQCWEQEEGDLRELLLKAASIAANVLDLYQEGLHSRKKREAIAVAKRILRGMGTPVAFPSENREETKRLIAMLKQLQPPEPAMPSMQVSGDLFLRYLEEMERRLSAP